MPQQFSLTPHAEADLDEILGFVADDSVEAAVRLHDKFLTQCRALAATPGIGRKRPELDDGVLSWPVGRYVIFYRSTERGIDVLRILHGARDLDALFKESNQ